MSALWALALIMLCSGVAKLRSREDVAETFRRLKVPRPFDAPALARAFPFLELLLAAALVQPFGTLRPVVAGAAVLLFAAFLALVVRAKGDGVSCGCFGEASAAPITGQTVVRNVLFLVIALLALAEALFSARVHGATAAWPPLTALAGGTVWAWSLLVALLLAAAALLVGRESVAPAEEPAAPAGGPGTLGAAVPSAQPGAETGVETTDEEDPAGPPRLPFGDAVVVEGERYTSLHSFVAAGAVVALRLSTGCGSCASVIARLPEFQDALGPVRLRVLLPQYQPGSDHAPHVGAIPEELVLVDPAGAASAAVGLTGFPMGVLLGTDLLTAGGPVAGSDEVLAFLEEIRDIMQTELPASEDLPEAAAADAEPLEAPEARA